MRIKGGFARFWIIELHFLDDLEVCLDNLESFRMILKVSGYVQNLANLKIDAIYALYPESFCDKNLAIRKVFAFCYSAWLARKRVAKGVLGKLGPLPFFVENCAP